jgi:5-methylcytosine-specific restriction endonuclease McrA
VRQANVYKGIPWPDDEALFQLFVSLAFSRKAVAEHLGRHPESLRAYLRKHRPELNARLAAATPPGKTGAVRSREYRARHLERRRAQDRAQYFRNRDQALEANRRWHRNNRHVVRERKRREFAADPDGVRARRRAWLERNRESVNLRVRFRYYRTRGGVLAQEYSEILLRDPCSYCGAPAEHVDHIDPLSRGGSPDWDNLTAACGSCNTSKQAVPLLAFLLARAKKG